mmetsp:Transcript_26242/g.43489  ORF Transcript_26242/g.43489 Transcript_26242/m.43489 type:complete len:258 (-) Transcript_26242:2376-3149(-)
MNIGHLLQTGRAAVVGTDELWLRQRPRRRRCPRVHEALIFCGALDDSFVKAAFQNAVIVVVGKSCITGSSPKATDANVLLLPYVAAIQVGGPDPVAVLVGLKIQHIGAQVLSSPPADTVAGPQVAGRRIGRRWVLKQIAEEGAPRGKIGFAPYPLARRPLNELGAIFAANGLARARLVCTQCWIATWDILQSRAEVTPKLGDGVPREVVRLAHNEAPLTLWSLCIRYGTRDLPIRPWTCVLLARAHHTIDARQRCTL